MGASMKDLEELYEGLFGKLPEPFPEIIKIAMDMAKNDGKKEVVGLLSESIRKTDSIEESMMRIGETTGKLMVDVLKDVNKLTKDLGEILVKLQEGEKAKEGSK